MAADQHSNPHDAALRAHEVAALEWGFCPYLHPLVGGICPACSPALPPPPLPLAYEPPQPPVPPPPPGTLTVVYTPGAPPPVPPLLGQCGTHSPDTYSIMARRSTAPSPGPRESAAAGSA